MERRNKVIKKTNFLKKLKRDIFLRENDKKLLQTVEKYYKKLVFFSLVCYNEKRRKEEV